MVELCVSPASLLGAARGQRGDPMIPCPVRCAGCGRLVDRLPPSRGCSPACRGELLRRKHEREAAEVRALLSGVARKAARES
jgi:hypothetical protein